MIRSSPILGAVLLLVGLSGLASSAHASVWVVDQFGRGDFTSLADAAAAVHDGDVLLVRSYFNSWPIQTLTLGDKSLTIVADGGLPDVDRIVVQGLPAGKTIVLRGLDMDAGLRLIDNLGSVRVEACRATGLSGSPGGPIWGPAADGDFGALVSGCANVAFSSCTLTGGPGANIVEDDTDFQTTAGGAGLRAEASLVTLTYCTVEGGQGGSDYDDGNSGEHGGDGVSNLDATLVLQGGSLVGGHGGNGGCNLFPSYCGTGGSGGDGLLSLTAGAASCLRDLEASGGEGGSGAGGLPDGLPGLPTRVVAGALIHWPQAAGRFSVSSPVREGETIGLLASGVPGDVVWTLVALSPAQAVKPAYQGSLLVGAPLLLLTPIGVIPALGSMQIGTTAPAVPASLDAFDVCMQGVINRGGAWLLGPTSTLTLLDASF